MTAHNSTHVKPTGAELDKLARMAGVSRTKIDGLMSVPGNRDHGSWRCAAVTDKQRDWLLAHGIPASIIDASDRGVASTIMTVLIRNSQEAWAWNFGSEGANDHDFS